VEQGNSILNCNFYDCFNSPYQNILEKRRFDSKLCFFDVILV
jgi:hypothetical protein